MLLQACERHAEAPPPSGCCSRMPTTARTMDCAAAVLFALGSWFLTRKLLPTHMRQYPGTNVTLPEGGAQIFVRDPQHLLAFVPDAQSSVGAVALRNLVVAHVVLLGVLAHWSRREGPVAVACICWAIGLTEVVTNSTKSGSMVKIPSQLPPWQRPRLAPCASSGRAWRPRAARHSQGEAQPLGPLLPPRGLKRAASKIADFTGFDPPGRTLAQGAAHARGPVDRRHARRQ